MNFFHSFGNSRKFIKSNKGVTTAIFKKQSGYCYVVFFKARWLGKKISKNCFKFNFPRTKQDGGGFAVDYMLLKAFSTSAIILVGAIVNNVIRLSSLIEHKVTCLCGKRIEGGK